MQMGAKKICLISAGLAGGGMERSLTSLANSFATHGHQVTIVNLFKTDVFFDLHPDIEIIWPQIQRESTHRLLYAVKLLPYLRREISRLKPDVVLSFGEYFNAYVVLSLLGMRQRLFLSDRMGPLLKLGFPLDQANKILYRFATGIIAQTQAAKKIIAAKTQAKNIIVVPNAVKPIDVSSLLKEKRIITVGRLSREKGHEILLAAFAELEDTSWILDIVGDGPKRNSLEEQAQRLGIAERVVFHGHQKHFAEQLGRASIFVLPSFYEGFPNALVEAMSVPLAVISSDCVAGPSEIITHGEDGLLFETGNVDALSDLMSELIKNPGFRERLSKNAYKVRKRFDFSTISQQYLEVLIES